MTYSGPGPSESSERTFHTRYTGDEPTSVAVIRALASVEGVAPSSLDPLYHSVDPDALDRIFDTPVVFEDEDVTAQFTASGYRVTIRTDGTITIRHVGESE